MPDLTTADPLLQIEFGIPFGKFRAADVQPAIADLLIDAQKRLDAITSAAGTRTFANTMEALDNLTERLDYAMGITRHLEAVATTPDLRAAFNAVQGEVSAFYSSLPLNE